MKSFLPKCAFLLIFTSGIFISTHANAAGLVSAPDFQEQAQSAVEKPEAAGLTDRQQVVHLLSRLSYAPTESMVAYVQSIGKEAWIREQLRPADPHNERLQGLLQRLPSLEYDVSQSLAFARGDESETEALSKEEKRKEFRKRIERLRGELLTSILLRSVASDRQAEEVLADFWRNHFNVTYRKAQQASLLITDWEREVIRGNMWGDFHAMLDATAKHPAMLHYLDQQLSRRKLTERELNQIHRRTLRRGGSEAKAEEAVAKASAKGPNENYARELMELHTLGVDRVYRQDDVVAVAEALTGWTVNRGSRQKPGDFSFRFDSRWHESGVKTLFDEPLPEVDPSTPAQGEYILDLLAEHKSTGDFLARKLVRYLVSDHPPEHIVQDVAETFAQSKGDLTQMVLAVIEHPDFYSTEYFGAKVKTPWEFVVSSLRVTSAQVRDPRLLFRALTEMGQPLYGCDVPTGWPEVGEAWLDPGAMAYRWNFATRLTTGKMRGVTIPPQFYGQVIHETVPEDWAERLAQRMVPAGLEPSTKESLQQVLQTYLASKKVRNRGPKPKDVLPELVALILGSPEFQRQ